MISTPKKESLLKRFRDILSDPNNGRIPRHPLAGQIADGAIVMHNGIKVKLGGYYDRFSDILLMNKGVHEPQEERVFGEVLKKMRRGATMLELGSYWAFYSLWFQSVVPEAKCFMVEPHEARLKVGKENFELNGAKGDFTKAAVGGEGGMTVDRFLEEKHIDILDILHSDIQGAEADMLRGASRSMAAGKIRYFFISTHSQEIHEECVRILEASGYEVIAAADYEKQTFCYDGIIVAKHHSASDGIGRIDIGDKSKTPLVSYGSVIGTYVTKVIGSYLKHYAGRAIAHAPPAD